MADHQLEFDFGPGKAERHEAVPIDWAKTREGTQAPSRTRVRFAPIGGRTRTARRRRILSGVRAAGVVLVFLVMAGYAFLWHHAHRSEGVDTAGNQVMVRIEPGMSATQACRVLEEAGVENAGAVLAWLEETGSSRSIQAGTFAVDRSASAEEIGSILTRAAASAVQVAPGMTISGIDTYLWRRGMAKQGEFRKAAAALGERYGLAFTEGWLLAGSYPEQDAEGLCEAMFRAMKDALRPLLDSQVVADEGVDALLIIASMVQSETQNEAEMPLISGILQNRLRQDMPLGVDATTRYELDDWEHPIPQRVYEQDTPYNTRRRPGLVPSGISCPSVAALEAAAHPADTDAFYYLHGKDGAIHTAVDYAGHQKNIERYMR